MSKIETFLKLWNEDKQEVVSAFYNYVIKTGITNLLSDESFIKLTFFIKMGRVIDLDNPRTFNEKLNWQKLYYRKPYLSDLIDKYEVKQIVREKIGDEFIIPTLGIWNEFDDISFESLPNKFVIKCTHDSGSVIICNDKKKFDIQEAKKRITKCLRKNHFYWGREWPYKNVKPRIIIEPLLQEESDNTKYSAIIDYKVYCFNGEPDCVMLCIGRDKGKPEFLFFNRDWKWLKYNKVDANRPDDFTYSKPQNMDLMFELAKKLAVGFPQVRVDFYEVSGKIYFSELTFCSDCGFDTDIAYETDLYWGSKFRIK